MADTSKERVEAIQQAARRLLEEHHDIMENLTLAKRRELAKILAKQVHCHPKTAKEHLTRALLRARGEWSEQQRGGARPGSGRPPVNLTPEQEERARRELGEFWRALMDGDAM